MRGGPRKGENAVDDLSSLLVGEAREPESRAELIQTIEQQIIPRLALAHSAGAYPMVACGSTRQPPSDAEIGLLAACAVRDDIAGAFALIESVVPGGLTLESVFLDFIAPAARLLGKDWLEDRRTFLDVTIGLSLLQRLVHSLGPSFSAPLLDRGLVLLTAAPGEQHTLGLFMLGEFFRRAGWGVQVEAGVDEAALLAHVRSERVDAIGFTVSHAELLPRLRRLIQAVKKASLNPDIVLLVGGGIALATFAAETGAATFAEPPEAVEFLSARVMRNMARDRARR